SHSVDSMDPADVMPVLKSFYPEKPEQDLAELAEVAVVNCPELTKGEQTGFEFVHKSFAEFLVAERFADLIEKVGFKSPEYGSEELTWRMSEQEAARELAPVFSIRLIPEEVQEMLEPMLGCFGPFAKGERVDDVVAAGSRKDGLTRIVDRFETLYAEFLRGGPLETVAKVADTTSLIRSSLEAYANYCAGLLIIGSAASRQLRQFNGKRGTHRLFCAEPSKGAFWRCLCILAAGGLVVERSLASRLLDGVGLLTTDGTSPIADTDSPMKLGLLNLAQGYDPNIPKHLKRCLLYAAQLEQLLFVMQLLSEFVGRGSQKLDHELFNLRDLRDYTFHRVNPIGELAALLVDTGMVAEEITELTRELDTDYRETIERIMYETREGGDVSHLVRRLMERVMRFDRPFVTPESLHRFERYLRRGHDTRLPE
ncbi:MAG: hypothetical protein ACRD9S_24030, partial [Pyrinomonadaceae bacterium]